MPETNLILNQMPQISPAFENLHLGPEHGLSVRILNCCEPFTIKELIAMGQAGRKKIRNYGKLCEQEFTNFIAQELSRSPSSILNEPQNSLIDEALTCAKLTTNPLRDLSHAYWAAITNAVAQAYADRTVRSLTLDLGLNWPKTTKGNEIWSTVMVKDYIGESLMEIRRRKTHGREKLKTIVKVISHCARESLANDSHDIANENAILRHNIFIALNGRARFVLENRLCKGESNGMLTLEEIALKFRVTRERIRQVEKIITDSVQASSIKNQFTQIEQCLVDKLRAAHSYIPDDFTAIAKVLSPEEWFSVHIRHAVFSSWLDGKFPRMKAGWFLGSDDELKSIEGSFNNFDFTSLPLPLNAFIDLTGQPLKLITAYLKLTSHAEIHDGYLINKGDGRARSIRSILLHKYLFIKKGNALTSLFKAACDLNGGFSFPNYRSLRDAALNTKSLLISNGSYVFGILPPGHDTAFSLAEIQIDKIEHAESSTSDEIYKFVKSNWPVELCAAVEQFKVANPNSGLTDSSIQAMMSIDPRIIRLSPAIYAPFSANTNDDSSRINRARKLALNEPAVRAYCLAKESGEDPSAFFLIWDYAQEQLWYRWLKKRNNKELLDSLVYVADQSKWPEQTLSERLGLKESKIDACFEIKPHWIQNRSYKCPSFEDILICARNAVIKKSFSWISANHMNGGSFIAGELGANIVVIMSALGILNPSKSHWRGRIPICTDAPNQLSVLEQIYAKRRGIGCWEDGMIKTSIADAIASAKNRQLGFVRADTLQELSKNLTDAVMAEDMVLQDA